VHDYRVAQKLKKDYFYDTHYTSQITFHNVYLSVDIDETFSLQDNDVRIVIAHFDVSLAAKVFCCVSISQPYILLL